MDQIQIKFQEELYENKRESFTWTEVYQDEFF